ncbi:MAG: HAMP domain-containing histidine kinase, partial [Acidimicrobiia bacterium]|nr:HAMP domain-containing histidine kinase [Acidimicrobiia bacterium]
PIPELPTEQSIGTFTGLVVDDDAFRVLTIPATTAEGPAALIVGRSLDEVTDGIGILAASLASAIPVIVIALTIVVWWLIGRTLAPVEAIRSEVADIGATRLDSRVPLPESRDEIHRLAETMNAMLDRLEHAVGAQQQFVADASHELRSPLARIRTELEIEPVEDETIASVREELIGLQHLVSDLLQLARFDARQANSREEVVDLDDLVFREGNNARTEGTAVDMSAVAAVQTTGSRQQLGRAIRNLVENARSHTTGSMALSLYEDGEFAVVTVADDGPGIPADQRDRIFERFARLDDARSQDAGGTGLGLAIAREIAERHGGWIVVDEGYTTGAKFVLRLPIYRS